jgi:hypothetical protein
MGILNKHTNSQVSINNQTSQSPNGITSSPVSFLAGRVKSIILDENSEGFNEFGEGNPGWNGLGLIQFQDITNPTSKISPAKPFFPNSKNFPLLEEIVWIIQLPSTNINGTSNNPGISTTVENYYLNPTALWNHPHHNGFPANPSSPPENQKRDYLQTSIGNVRRVTDQSTELNLGKTFIERSNIHPLKPFEGDVIYEGRWGNSIRIGSTVKLKKPLDTPLNNWSTGTSTSGDPILILRNGQGTQTNEGWVPIVEDINNDDSSIYFTSTQKIPLKASSTSYNSYKTTPTTPDQYAGKQVIITSGRLVFNTTEDHLLLSSKKSVNLNAQESVNIDAKLDTIVSSPSIKLGSKDATEPILKGDALVTELQNLINQLIQLTTTLVAVPQVSTAASLVLSELPKISARIALTKSKVNKII